MDKQRIVSGMRATGALHLGHYHGVLKNWIQLQHEHECLFFVADLHALTTHYDDPVDVAQHSWDMVIDWLAAGLNPGSSHLFIQSRVPEHAELHLLLSMITPLGWLERVPTYKDQQEKLKERDLSTYGFLGYPLLQAADVLAYKANSVPVGEDQLAHLELTREIARRFNHLYGRDGDFEARVKDAIESLGKKGAKSYKQALKAWQELGDEEAKAKGIALINQQGHLSIGDKDTLLGHLDGSGRIILPEPQALLTPLSKMPGLDGHKMSKSYHNTIGLREAPDSIRQKLKVMPTDPARVKRTDPGEPKKCPVWAFHEIYSEADTQDWVTNGCRSAGIGCLDCKTALTDAILKEQAPMLERAKPFEDNPGLVKDIVHEGCEAAREIARETLAEVKDVMGLVDS